MSDPVADKSGFLRMYMSNHPDTLVAYARWHGQVKDALISAEMTAIDSEVCILTYLAHEPIPALANRLYISQSMTLTCKLKDGSSKVVRIVLDPPLLGYEEVKPRLLAMKVDAQEGLGMVWLDIVFREIKYLISLHSQIRTPQISTFRLPPITAASVALVLGLCYLTYFPRESSSILYRPAQVMWKATGGDLTIRASWILLGILHGIESIYTYTLCRRHRTGFRIGVSSPHALFHVIEFWYAGYVCYFHITVWLPHLDGPQNTDSSCANRVNYESRIDWNPCFNVWK